MKLGILGGTFDPIHLGHLRAAEEVGQKLNLEKVYLIPSASPPHKTDEPVAPFYHRLEMARLSVGDSHLLEVLDLEGKRPGLSYSIETLREFHDVFGPQPELFFILGMDAFLEVEMWKDYRDLFDYAHFIIIKRPGFQEHELEPFLSKIGLRIKRTDQPDVFIVPSGYTVVQMFTTPMGISSTSIREMITRGKSVRFLLPETVRKYILERGLYRDNASP